MLSTKNRKIIMNNNYSEKERLDKFIKNSINRLKLMEQWQEEFEIYSGIKFLNATDPELENYIMEHFSEIQSIFIQSIMDQISKINHNYNNVISNLLETDGKITFKTFASKFDLVIAFIEHVRDSISICTYCFDDNEDKKLWMISFNLWV